MADEPKPGTARPSGSSSGEKVVRHVLADGSVREYRYPRATRRKRTEKPVPAVEAIFRRYERDPFFQSLSPDWRSQKIALFREIQKALSDMTLRDLEDVSARGRFYEMRDSYAETPHKADKVVSALNTALEWAYDRGMLKVNHAHRIKPLTNPKQSRHRDKQYTMEQEETLLRDLPADLRDVYLFALYTGLRRADCVAIPPTAIDRNGWLAWRPLKTRHNTNVTVYLPTFAFPPLAELIARLPQDGDRLLMAGRGVAFGRTNLSHRWGRWMAALGMPGMRFQDIRHTTSSRLIFAGCTEAERAMILGHATADGTGAIYIARMKELALFAYQKWWAQMNGTARVIRLENARGKDRE